MNRGSSTDFLIAIYSFVKVESSLLIIISSSLGQIEAQSGVCLLLFHLLWVILDSVTLMHMRAHTHKLRNAPFVVVTSELAALLL